MSTTRKARVIVVGGDDRVESMEWPSKNMDVRGYATMDRPQSVSRAVASISSGKVDHVVCVTRFMGHSDWEKVRDAAKDADIPCTLWPTRSGLNQLAKTLPALVRAPIAIEAKKGHDSPLLRPTPVVPTPPPMETIDPRAQAAIASRRIVAVPESFGKALRRLRLSRGLSQSGFARVIGATQSQLSVWELGKSAPTGTTRERLLLELPELVAIVPAAPGPTITAMVDAKKKKAMEKRHTAPAIVQEPMLPLPQDVPPAPVDDPLGLALNALHAATLRRNELRKQLEDAERELMDRRHTVEELTR